MNYQYDRSFTFMINDDEWECYLITEEEGIELDDKLHNEDASESFAGMVTYEPRCLFIPEGQVKKDTIAHELFHINMHYLHFSSADLTVNQLEEVIAVWIENDVDKFVTIRDKLYNEFKKLEDTRNK